MTDTLKTVQALVEALDDIADCGAEAWGEHRNCNKQARAALTAGRALIAQMQRDALQSGWKLVPMEPTEEMLGWFNPHLTATMYSRYKAMLAAAPQPAPEPQQDQLQQPRCRYCNGSGAIEKFACHDCDGTGKARGISYAESELQQPDGHSTRASGVCASTTPAPLFAVGVAQRKWESLQADGYRMQSIAFARSIDGQETRGIIDPWGRVLWKYGQDDHAGSPAPSEPVGWLESPHGAYRSNPLHKLSAPQSVAWSLPVYLGRPESRGEPVAWRSEPPFAYATYVLGGSWKFSEERLDGTSRPLYTHPAPSEPVATLHDDGHYTFKPGKEPWGARQAGWRMDVYAAQSSKAALSDEDIMQLARENTWLNGSHEFCNYIPFARAILARAGITPQAGKESGDAS